MQDGGTSMTYDRGTMQFLTWLDSEGNLTGQRRRIISNDGERTEAFLNRIREELA